MVQTEMAKTELEQGREVVVGMDPVRRPLRMKEIVRIAIVVYGRGSATSHDDLTRMRKALEATGLRWRRLCPEHAEEIERCTACQAGEWHLATPPTPDDLEVLDMRHVEGFIDAAGEHEYDVRKIEAGRADADGRPDGEGKREMIDPRQGNDGTTS